MNKITDKGNNMADAMKVALIEDDPSISTMYKLKLEQEGFEVETASDGDTGFEMVEKFKPDVILLDVMMPLSGGVDFMSILRAKPDFDNTKVIVMTNLDDTALRNSMSDFKVSDYLVKADTTPAGVVEKIRAL